MKNILNKCIKDLLYNKKLYKWTIRINQRKKEEGKPKKDIKKQENVENVITNNMIIKLNHITEDFTIIWTICSKKSGFFIKENNCITVCWNCTFLKK